MPSRKTATRFTFCAASCAAAPTTATASTSSRLAGIPEEIIQRAQQILKQLESGALPSPKHKPKAQPEPMVLVQKDDSELVRRLKEIDIEKITPVQALVLLSELKARI